LNGRWREEGKGYTVFVFGINQVRISTYLPIILISRFVVYLQFFFLQMIQVLWAVSTGNDFPEALCTTGLIKTILALRDTVFVLNIQCDQFITLRLKIHNVLP